MPKGDREIFKADPEDGTTPIANLLLEGLFLAKLTSMERAACLFLIRRTYGWQINGQRLRDDIVPLTDWQKALQAKDISIASRVISKLVTKRVISRDSLGPGKSYVYSMNTRLDQWNNCFDGQDLSTISTLVLNRRTRVVLTRKSNPLATNLAMGKKS